jgi:ABC-type uncharacterized transport system substrate-binding protein
MDRRTFLSGLALEALAIPRIACAQPAHKVYRIGILASAQKTADLVGPQTQSPSLNALLRGLSELGYVYGQHFVTEPRGGDGRPELFARLAAELVRLQVDVIVAAGPTLSALKQATSTIRVVMGGSTDPVGLGYVQSLGRPGGNFTGLSRQGVEITGKRLELLKELVPTAAPVGILWDEASRLEWQVAEAAARERGWTLLSLKIREPDAELEGAFKKATDARAGGLVVVAAGILFTRARRVAELAARSRLPAVYELRRYVDAGGLISYSPDLSDIWRRAAVFVDKILKGTKPADLPVEQPTKFELVINLKTANALGLTIPQSVLLRADQVIE